MDDIGPEAETWSKLSEKWLFHNVSREECVKHQLAMELICHTEASTMALVSRKFTVATNEFLQSLGFPFSFSSWAWKFLYLSLHSEHTTPSISLHLWFWSSDRISFLTWLSTLCHCITAAIGNQCKRQDWKKDVQYARKHEQLIS